MKSILITLILLTGLYRSYAQDAELLTNESIIELVASKVSKKLILTKITNSPCDFTTDTRSIVALKKAKVDEGIISAMMEKMSSQKTRQIRQTPQKTGNATPASTDAITKTAAPTASRAVAMLKKEGSGIYYYQSSEAKVYELEATVFSQAKSNSWATSFTYGFAKSSKVMSVSGSEANVQFGTANPIFYFYFDPENKSLNEQAPTWFANVSSPNEFLLIKFENKKVKNSRAVITASGNSYEQAQGIDDKFKVSFKFKRLEKGVYEIYFDKSLEPGEYGFMYAGATATRGGSSPRVYDFGIQ